MLCCARLRRDWGTYRIAALGVLGSLGIALVWGFGIERWAGLLTSLVGMAAGGGIIWSVRIVGTAVLRREAMGFGDVTLMAMIGSFLGWQPCLVIFFLAPFAGLAIGLFSLVLHRQSEIPYGPFLCLAAAFVVVRWADLWQWAEAPFSLGLLVPAMMLVGLVLMAGLLGLWCDSRLSGQRQCARISKLSAVRVRGSGLSLSCRPRSQAPAWERGEK